MVQLDGSLGEGGGQILRTSLTLSLLTGRPFRLSKIRANRAKGGLRPQHLTAFKVAAVLGNAKTTGGEIDSRQVTFAPQGLDCEDRTIDIGTAGSTGLVLQTIQLPIAMRSAQSVRISLIGGTFNPKAPAFPFLKETWSAFLNTFGMPLSLAMPKAGFYPRGGGRLDAEIGPAARPASFRKTARGPLTRIRVASGVANLPDHIAERMIARTTERLAPLFENIGAELIFEPLHWPSVGQGAAVAIVAEYADSIPATFVGIGERGKPAETVADEAIDEFLAFDAVEHAAVDPHSADQILLPLALAEGPSEYTVSEVTEHLRTNAATIRAFLDRKIVIDEPDGPGQPGTVTIHGS
ncbi:MAG: RNA 3'-terminal-phosphate cyclase [Planctomycetes bacterium SCN 63-9]|nr:MAG: RNA 3'-terminal-phosphate cyclase [Planctomycetes bacterium SCN 63-9]